MTVELRPLGVACNLRCQYCYQNPQRDAGNVPHDYDMERMRAAIEAEGGPFTLFGGEPLLIPLPDLEELWAWGLEQYGNNSLQTNGAAIKDEHYPLFTKYKVHVGISIDGPGRLNDARWAGTVENTRAATARTERAIERLCREDIAASLIITLHRGNATADKLPVLYDWVRYLDGIGIRSARLHILESESDAVRAKYGLTTEENVAAFTGFAQLEPTLQHLRFDVFTDMRRMLVGEDNNTTCIWNACDPYTTRAVRGVEGHGQRSNCGRTNKDGIDFVKSDVEGFERYIALYHTPQEAGGCHDCRFFLMCKGQCPGTAIDGDWRNRTEHCEVWKTLYTRLEHELEDDGVEPLSRSPLRAELERGFLDAWSAGVNGSMAQLLARHPERRPAPGAWRRELDQLRIEAKGKQQSGSGT
jgi:uncharacterized protein